MELIMKCVSAVLIHVMLIGVCHGANLTTTNYTSTVATTELPTSVITTQVTDTGTTVNVTDTTEVTSMFSQETTAITTSEATTTGKTTPFHTTRKTHPTHSPDNKPPIGTWNSTDDKGNVCMKMKLGVRFNISYVNTTLQTTYAIIDAPLTSHPVANCTGAEREFKLHLFNDGSVKFFYLSLTFKSSSKYKLTDVGLFYTLDHRLFVNATGMSQTWLSVGAGNFLNNSIPLQKSFTCGHTLQPMGTIVTLYDVQFMPYADENHGDFGDSAECKNATSFQWVGILVVVALVFVIAGVVVGAVLGYKKYKKSRNDDMRQPIIQNA